MKIAAPQIENHSTTESPESMREAGARYGIDFEVTTIKTGLATEEEAAAARAAEETSKPVEGDKPADTEQAVTDDKAKPKGDLETPEQADSQEPKPDGDEPSEHKKLLRRIDKLTARFRTEEGNNKALKEEIAELRRQMATSGDKKPETVAPPPEVVDNAPKRPARPPRPKLEQFEYDQTRYDAAMDEYEEKTIPAYEDALSAYTRAEAVREMQANREAEEQAEIVRQNNEAWQEALDSREGFRDKLAAATDINRSPAMAAVMDSLFEPMERIEILDYLIDNPEEADRILHETLGPEGKGKTTAQQWAYLTSVAAKEFTAIVKESKAAAKAKPGPVEVPPKPKSQPAPPAKPKPPVSAAPAPIEPVGGRAGATQVRLDDPNVEFDAYRAAREQQTRARRQAQFGR